MDHGDIRHGGMDGMGRGSGRDGMGGMDGKGHGGGMMKEMMCGFTEHLDAGLAYLKTELKITEQQTPQWNAFADAWRAVAQKASAKCTLAGEHQMDAKQGVPGKLSMMETHMADHLEIVRAQKAALEPLYNVLTDEQKKAANETLTRVMKVGMSMGGGGMGGMQHDGDGGKGRGEMGRGGKGGMGHGGMGMGGMGMGGMGHGGMGQGGSMGGMHH
ncbi:Spy/CpxP family protein refolding chaperone [Methylocystis echinoides]|uniref:Spy/CpxP family protein refolding chaperone n=1 Tax=Methylocystis echinoides TaxID=29468 RepID=UPI0034332A27